MRPKNILWPALWVTVIFLTSSTVIMSREFVKTVATAVPSVTESNFAVFWGATWFLFVKGYHVLEYFVLYLLFLAAFKGSTATKLESRLVAALATLIFAALDEFHQTFVPGRGGLVSDVLIDGVGVLLGLAFAAWREKRAERQGVKKAG